MKKYIKPITIFAIILCVNSFNVSAQPCDPNTDPFCDEDGGSQDPFEPIPIDGGAVALLVGGAALGYKALKKKNNNSAIDK